MSAEQLNSSGEEASNPHCVDTRPSDPIRDVEQLTSLLKLLADPTRMAILMRLAGGECNVSALCDELKLPQPTVSHHLGLLRLSNVISNRRDGKQVFYSLGGRMTHPKPGAIEVIAENHTIHIAPRQQRS